MTQRPDQLQLSLGPEAEHLKATLLALADALNIIGRKGPSISQLVIWLAETYDGASAETVAALEIARGCARGGDWDELIETIRPRWTE